MTLVEKKRDWEDVDPQIREKLETEYTGQQVVMGAPIRGTFHVPRNAWDVIPPGKLLRMMRQPTISFVKTMIEVTGATSVWDVDAEPGVPEEAVKLVEKIIKEIKTDLWRAFCHAATTAGFLACEKVFEFVQAKDLPSSNLESVDEYISLRKLHELLPENVSILMDARDGFKGIRVNAPFMVNLPPEKCVVFTHDRHADDLYGKAILLNVEQAFDLYDQGLRNLDAFEQRMRLPIYIMTYPMQMSLVDGKLIDNGTLSKQYMTEMFDKQVIALGRRPNTDPTLTTATDSDWKIEKLPGENMTGDFLAGFYYYDKLIVRGFGFPERALLEGIYGTKADAANGTDYVTARVEHLVETLVYQLNRYVIEPILRANWVGVAGNCRIKAGPIMHRNAEVAAGLLRGELSTEFGQSVLSRLIDWEVLLNQADWPTTNLSVGNNNQIKMEDQVLAAYESRMQQQHLADVPSVAGMLGYQKA